MLIETKLHPPPARKEWVERPDLIRRLDEAPGKLILLAAPPGFGKTTVVTQWCLSPDNATPFAWLSLDRDDNDPGRLWRHLVCALGLACPAFDSEKVLGTLRGQAPDFGVMILPTLVNELAALPGRFRLVLDDYDVISEPACQEQLAFLVGHLPRSGQVVIGTRAEPPLPLARMRAAAEITEIGPRELRFGTRQAAELIQSVAGVQLTGRAAADLVERSEGWPAGLYLAALSLRGHPDPDTFVRRFSGENRFIVDYLVDDVLGRQPDEIREFLLRTSILGRFCAPLCDAVTGTGHAAALIEALERGNLFVIPLDENRRWFRYHHLFAQVLRSQLDRTEPDLVPVLHARASAWHQESGSADEAVTHALAAGDAEGATGLIARHYYAYIDSGQAATVRRWLALLGPDGIVASPLAAHCAAWTAAISGDQRTVRRCLPIVEAAGDTGPLPDGMRSFASSAAILQAIFGFDGLVAMRAAGQRALALETDPDSRWHAAAQSGLSGSLYLAGEFGQAAVHARAARRNPASLATVRLLATAVLTWVAVRTGRLADADELAAEAGKLVTDPGLGLAGTPQSSLGYLATGAVLAAHGNLPAARDELERALELRRQWPGLSLWPTLETLLSLALVLAGLGDRAGGTALLDEARRLLDDLPGDADAQLARLEQLERRLAGRSRPTAAGEPLSEREQEVLRLLQGTLSIRDIGRELYLSPNTIKTHTRTLYRKLAVSDRREAVARGRELGLLLAKAHPEGMRQ